MSPGKVANPSIAAISLLSLSFVALCASGFNLGSSAFSGEVRQLDRARAQQASSSTRPVVNSFSTGAGGASSAVLTMVAAEPVAGLLKTVTVDLGDRSYPIYIGTGLLERCAVAFRWRWHVSAINVAET